MWGVIIKFALSAQHRRAERPDTALSAVSFQAPSHRAARSSPSPAEQMRGRVSLKEGTACAKSLQNTTNVRRHQHQHPRIPHTVLKDTLRNSIKLPPRCPFMAPQWQEKPEVSSLAHGISPSTSASPLLPSPATCSTNHGSAAQQSSQFPVISVPLTLPSVRRPEKTPAAPPSSAG